MAVGKAAAETAAAREVVVRAVAREAVATVVAMAVEGWVEATAEEVTAAGSGAAAMEVVVRAAVAPEAETAGIGRGGHNQSSQSPAHTPLRTVRPCSPVGLQSQHGHSPLRTGHRIGYS